MSKVVNLNRYRKRKAREDKERRAETNRRLHGRTKAERVQEAADKQRLEKQLAGAFLVPERVPVEALLGDPEEALRRLEQATRDVPTLSQFSERLRARDARSSPSQRRVGAEQAAAQFEGAGRDVTEPVNEPDVNERGVKDPDVTGRDASGRGACEPRQDE